jgi:hypothetical protein
MWIYPNPCPFTNRSTSNVPQQTGLGCVSVVWFWKCWGMLVREQHVVLNLNHLISCNIDGAPVGLGHAGSGRKSETKIDVCATFYTRHCTHLCTHFCAHLCTRPCMYSPLCSSLITVLITVFMTLLITLLLTWKLRVLSWTCRVSCQTDI